MKKFSFRVFSTRQTGVGMLEVLLTVCIISIGFLAAARMQIEGLKISQNSYFRAQAFLMAEEMIDKMRVNIDGLNTGAYDGKATSSTAVNRACEDNYCDGAAIAEYDIFQWSRKLHNLTGENNFIPLLPSGNSASARGEIQALGNGVYQISVFWSEVTDGEETEQNITISFKPAT